MAAWKIHGVVLSPDQSQIVRTNWECVLSSGSSMGSANVSPQALDANEADLITATKAGLGSDQVTAIETEPETSSDNLHRTFPIIASDAVEEFDFNIDAARVARNKRNALLIETDYLALSDTTLSSDMAVYRQALRDITKQAEFPANVTWPAKP